MVEFVTYYLELPVALIRLLFIFLGIVICTEVIKKSTKQLKDAMTFFLISFIPSTFYTLGKLINIEAMFSSGKLISTSLNTLTTVFILIGLISIKSLINDLEKTVDKIKGLDTKSREIVNSVNKLKSRLYSLKGAYEKKYVTKEAYDKGKERIGKEYGNLKEEYSRIYKDYCFGFGK